MKLNSSFWNEKNVLLTGHTGFKGGWMSLMLKQLGAKVHGLALYPEHEPNLYAKLDCDLFEAEYIGDITDSSFLIKSVAASEAEIVIHMAAQPLVKSSYLDPYTTYNVNVMGTINILEAIRHCRHVRSFLNVTTDKVYLNREWLWPYRENEALGGRDPYSASKSCADLITSSYFKSFLSETQVGVATGRAGNVIGGGDWALNRLVPDFFRQLNENNVLKIRNPLAIRPWQHVLEPINGYLLLLERLWEEPSKYSGPWNFGPLAENHVSVRTLINILSDICGVYDVWCEDDMQHEHEANILKLDISKSQELLSWHPKWNIQKTLNMTAEWYIKSVSGEDVQQLMLDQLKSYTDWDLTL